MKVLILYATYSGGTAIAAQTVADVLKTTHEVTTTEVSADMAFAILSGYDLIIFASPSWLNNDEQGQPHQFFLDFMKRHEGETMPNQKFAVFGLGDTNYPNFCGAVDHLVEYVNKLGGTLIIDPLRIDGFFFDQDNNTTKLTEWAKQLKEKING